MRVIAIACLVVAAAAVSAQNEGNVQMQRLHAQPYYPGEPVDVQIVIDTPSAGIKAMGLRETIPDGWTLAGVRAVDGAVLPAVVPAVGAGALLEFAWIEIPEFPYSFVYTVVGPEEDDGEAVIFHGKVEYRLDAGAQYAEPVITTIKKGTWKQGVYLLCAGGAPAAIPGWSDGVTILVVLCVLLMLTRLYRGTGQSA